jgi:hypothetical protein
MSIKKASIDSKSPSLRRWRVMEVVFKNGTRSRHVWGHEVTRDEGRASTAIIEFNLETMTATTSSGSHYQLLGVPGNARNGEYVWRNWCQINQVVSEVDVTHEYLSIEE